LFFAEISRATVVGETCDPDNCGVTGWCKDYTFCEREYNLESSSEDFGHLKNETCPDGLYFHPNATEFGGICDEWANLPEHVRQQYKSDPACSMHCWFEAEDCSAEYTYHEIVDGKFVSHQLTCPGGLLWNNEVRTCTWPTEECQGATAGL